MVTPKMQIAFPTIGQIRKGAAKARNERGVEVVGKDLGAQFRVVFFPGNGGADEVFRQEYGGFTPERIHAMVPFRSIGESWTVYNEAYNAGRMIAQADDAHFLTLRNPQTGEYVVRDGQPFKEYHPGQAITYQGQNGKQISLKIKTYGRLRLFLPIFERMVTLELRTTSFYDRINITEQLGAITAAAEALNNGNCAGIPFWIYRRPTSITWNKPDGSAARVDKWLINIEIDSEWVKAAIARLRRLSMGEQPAGLLAPLAESHPDARPAEIEAPQGAPDPEQDTEEEEDVIEGSFRVTEPGGQPDLFAGKASHAPVLPPEAAHAKIAAPAPAPGNGKAQAAPVDNAPMTIYEACDVLSSEGVRYGDIPSEKLSHMARTLGKIAKPTPEQETKLLAIGLITKDRAGLNPVSKPGENVAAGQQTLPAEG